MKKRKNRPLFPNGYNVKKKVKPTVSKPNIKAQRTLDILLNSYKKIFAKNAPNIAKYNNLLKERELMMSNGTPVGIIQSHDVKMYKYERIANAAKLVEENLWRRLEEWQENPPVKLGKWVSEKNMALFESWWDVNLIKNSAGQLVYDEETRNKQMILQGLINRGYNVYDPRVLRNTLKGISPDELYYVWIFRHEDEDYYEAFFNHIDDTIDELLDEITSPGFDIQHYKDYREIILNINKRSRWD